MYTAGVPENTSADEFARRLSKSHLFEFAEPGGFQV